MATQQSVLAKYLPGQTKQNASFFLRQEEKGGQALQNNMAFFVDLSPTNLACSSGFVVHMED